MKASDRPCADGIHEEYPNYHRYLSCGTDECGGLEVHCRKCGWFISECGCGYLRGASKISDKAWNTIYRKKRERRQKQRVVDANRDSIPTP
jgi:hypothetical protein